MNGTAYTPPLYVYGRNAPSVSPAASCEKPSIPRRSCRPPRAARSTGSPADTYSAASGPRPEKIAGASACETSLRSTSIPVSRVKRLSSACLMISACSRPTVPLLLIHSSTVDPPSATLPTLV